MFSGIVEVTARVREAALRNKGMRLVVGDVPFADTLAAGESISINGACMTVTATGKDWFAVDVSLESLAVTRMGEYKVGETLNLERPLRLSDRLGGHLVLGHVDGLGMIEERKTEGETTFMTVSIPHFHRAYVIPKGSITVEGISLTVNTIVDSQDPPGCRIGLAIIPHTLKVTNLADRKTGDRVQLEYDVIGKYILRAKETGLSGIPGLEAE
jgi:riboflavin synthase